MENISEKTMEDAIAGNPEQYIKEKALKLLSRQYTIGSYRFDLLFEDRHGGKLIVEIQKGTLDRVHTYKILDYYHEYKDQNPEDFIDVMVIANIIPPERKRRLSNLGIEYKEIPESAFMIHKNNKPLFDSVNNLSIPPFVSENSKELTMANTTYNFKSIGPSAFINSARQRLSQEINSKWILGGESSLTVKNSLITETVKKLNKDLVAQIWMERPKKGVATCKFEFSSKKILPDDLQSKRQREKIAESFRLSIKNKLPKEIKFSTGSTVIKVKINLSKINDTNNDFNDSIDKKELEKIVPFYYFLDKELDEWNKSLKNLIATDFFKLDK